MTIALTRILRLSVAPMMVAAVVVGCTETKTEFVEVPAASYNPPPDSANGFLGYFDAANKQTTCGNCHVSGQGKWSGHGHSDAWNTLENSGHAQDFCRGCHTLSENGNVVPGPAGWNVVQTDVYYDVQCESCHGPGVTHVETPDGGTGPLASIRGDSLGPASCATCHSGNHHGFSEAWAKSRHSQMNSYPQGRADCIACHTGQGALQAFGVTNDYIEKDAPLGQHEDITCAVCHDPHGSGITAQLRFPIDVPVQDQNLCIKCHHKRGAVDSTSSSFRGPHSPEGPLLLGQGAGWFPPNFTPNLDTIRGTHGSTANPDLCATCHVDQFTVTDAETGNFIMNVTGHRFLAIPCVDANGAPTDDQTCAFTPAARSWNGCTNGGCHGDATAAATSLLAATTRLGLLETQLETMLNNTAQVPPSELDPNSGVFTSAKGASFNLQLSRHKGSSTHNPFLLEQLLIASIAEVNAVYGPFPIVVDLEYQLH